MNKELESLIQKAITGNISPQEQYLLNNLLKGQEAKYTEIKTLWDKLKLEDSHLDFNEDAAWEKLNQRIHTNSIRRKKRFYINVLAGIAAMLVLIFSVTFWFIKFNQPIESYTSHSYMEVFYLPDGTQVWLNKNSTITLESFTSTERKVSLVGEAYFKVHKDPTRPFTINAGNSSTKVLGTEFTLKAYPDQDKIEIKVESGRVLFSSRSDANESTILYGNEAGYMTVSSNKIQKVIESYKEEAWLHSTTKITKDKPVSKHIKEVYTHKDFLQNSFSVKENLVKQSVIQGEISNSALITSYKSIKLKVEYRVKGDEIVTEYFDLPEYVSPGGRISYKLRVGGWFKHRKIEKIDIVDAHAIQ